MWKSIVDHPELLPFLIAVLFFGAVTAIGAISMSEAVMHQRERQKQWLDNWWK